jgi:polysaccharide chain length determinant protein (PEP-CTERM system associated)
VLTPGDYLDILQRRKWSLILPILIILLAAGVVAVVLPSIYLSQATILIEEQEIPQDFVMTTVTSYAEQRMQQLNQRIMSFSRLVEIIERFGLYPESKDKKTTEEIVEQMRADTRLEPVSAEIIDRRTGRPATATIAFTLSYEGKDPAVVQQVANVLTSLYLSENLQVREKQAQETSAFLEGEMDRVRGQLAKLESRIAAFKQQHLNELPEMLPANMRSLDDMKRNLEVVNERLNSLHERELHLDTYLAGIKPHIEDQDQKVTTRNRLEELKVQLVHLTKRFSEEYPDVKKTRAEIAELERQLEEDQADKTIKKKPPDNPLYISVSTHLVNTKAEIALLQNQIGELNLSIAEYQRRIAATPRVEEAYNALAMERNNTQIKYNDLMAKHMEARVAQGLEKDQKGERFTLIEPPRRPEKPFKPNRLAIMLIGVVLGIGAGVGWAALREFSDDAVRNADQLTFATKFPVLASIPEIQSPEDIARQRKKRIVLAAGTACAILVALLVLHFVIMDLDIFWVKLMRRLAL